MTGSKTAGARRSRILMTSLGATTAAAITVLVVLMLSGATAEAANTCTLSSTAGTLNWNAPSSWPGCTSPGGYPNSGDTAIVNTGPTNTLVVNIPVDVILQLNNQVTTVDVQNTLTLEPSSTSVSGSGITINSGGTYTIPAGQTAGSSIQSNITLNSGGVFSIPAASTYTFGASSNFTFAGGTIQGPGNLMNPASHAITINGSSGAMSMSNLLFDNSGVVNYTTATNSLSIDSGTQFNNQSGGIFNFQSSPPILTNGSGAFNNQSGATVNAASGTNPEIDAPVNNDGSILLLETSLSQTFKLLGGGTHTGNFDSGNPATGTFVFNGPHNFNAGWTWTSGPSSVFEVDGGVTTLNTSLVTAYLTQNGGTITGPGNISVSSFLKWNAGTESGTGFTDISGLAHLDGTQPLTLDGRLMKISGGTFSYINGFTFARRNARLASSAITGLSMLNSAQLNMNGGSIDLQDDDPISTDGTASIVISSGSLLKSSGTKITIHPPVTIGGSLITIQPSSTAILEFAGGGSIGAGTSIDTSTGSSLEFSGASMTVSNTPTINSGNFIVSGATLAVNAPFSLATLTFSAGTIKGSSTLTINTTYNWSGGTLDGDTGGTGILAIGAGAIANITGLSPVKVMHKFTLQNAGTVNYTPANALAVNTGGQIINSGTWLLANAAAVTSDNTAYLSIAPAFSNSNILRKTAGAITTFAPYLINTGTIDVQSTFISFTGGGTMTAGSMPGSTPTAGVEFASGTYAISGGTLSGAGGIKINGATVSLDTINFNGPNSFALLTGNLTTAGGGSLTMTSGTSAQIFGGNITGGLQVNANSGSTFTFNTTAPVGIDGAIINLASGSTASWSGASPITMSNGAQIGVTCNFTWTATAPIAYTTGTMPLISVNTGGTLYKTGSSSPIGVAVLLQNNGGLIKSDNGALQLNTTAGSIHSGTFNPISPGSIEFTTGSHTFNTITETGTGFMNFLSGTMTFNNPATLVNLYMGTVTLAGAGPLTFTGTFNWDGGALNVPTTNSGGTLNLLGASSQMDLGANLSSGANFSSASSAFAIGSGVTFTNTGTFTITGNAPINNAGTFTNNAGSTLTKTGGTSTTIFTTFNNNGTVNAVTGALNFMGNGTDTGTYSSSAGASLNFGTSTRTLTSTASIGPSANGATILGPGLTFVVNGIFTPTGPVTINGGSATLNTTGTATISALTMSSGSLAGTSPLQLSGTSNWSGGTIQGSGSFTLNAGGVLNLSGASTILDGRTLTNSGTINVNNAGTALTINNNGSIANQASGLIALMNDGSIISMTGLGTSSINNAGIFRKSCCASGTSNVDATFSNLSGGMLDLQAGTVNFTGFMGQSGGTTKLNGGTFAATSPANFTGGILTGSGSFNASLLNNGATINPDSGIAGVPGTITIGSAWTQTAGNVIIDLFGNGSNDLVTVPTSSASVGGTLTIQLVSPYVPVSGHTFNVLHASSLSDTTTKSYPVYGPSNTGSFNATATASDLTLTAFLNQADLSITKSGPATVGAGSNAVYTVTVTNGGPVAASSVTITDPAVAGLTFVSASGACTAFPCNLTSLAASSSAAITATYSTSPSASTTATNTATVSSATNDPNTTNNSASITTAIVPSSDIAVTVTGPSTALPNSNVTLTVKVSNLGPSNATGVSVSSSIPSGMTFVSNSGACTTNYPCAIGALNAGQFVTITSVYSIGSNGGTTLNPSFTASSATADPNNANNTATRTIIAACPSSAPSSLSPGNTQTGVPVGGALSWNDVNAAKYNVYLGPMGSGCNAPYGTVVMGPARVTQLNYSGLDEGATYEWAVEAVTPGCPTLKSSCVRFQTLTTCNATAPTPLTPNGSIVSSPVTFTWTASAGATLYTVRNAANDAVIGTSTTTSLSNITVDNGPISWYVVADVPGCGALRSATVTFNACTPPLAPLAGAVAEAATGQTFAVQWDRLNHVTSYSLEEARNEAFDNPVITVVAQPAAGAVTVPFTKQTTSGAATFFYRVRAKSDCNDSFGPYSIPIRVVVLPPPPPTQHNPNVTVPVGSKLVVVQQVFIPGINDGIVHTFSATVDKPWLTVIPSAGILPADGITLDVKADPSTLPNGTATGTVIVTISSGTGKTGSNGSSTVTVPVSVNLVTPVIPSTKDLPPDNALIIPAVGHLDGLSSHWQSDIRLANTGSQKLQYALKFTPADPASGVKTTTIDVDGGATTALDDIVRNWYGIGTLGESANGSLEIRPIVPQSKTGSDDTPSISKVTVVSSRTYNVSDNGTLGQFIPAIPFSSFIGKAAQNAAASVLSLQQIAQSQQYRTNIGIVEGAGAAVNVLVTVFDVNGNKLKDVPLALKAGQQMQVSNFLASVGIPTLNDGRVEVKVTSGEGRVTAYASVVDNQTSDPLLVSGVKLGAASANRYVLPGVADINTGAANWRTDVRVFNGGTAAQNATLTLFRSGAAPLTQQLVINAGEIRTLDSIVASMFGVTGTGGAVHVSTPSSSNLIVSARTYNATSSGTYGQYIPAVTAADSIGNSDRPLQILQVEDSVRYRTNVGLAEVTGKPAGVDVSVNLPDSKVTPVFHINLGANDFQQFNVFRALGLENIYNARISIRVTDGDGKVTAYGSVVDMLTQDPTYVPAQ